MALSVGIVGMPNVGKSTTFNALTKAQNAQAANYPFCTIDPNKAIVPVPDVRMKKLSDIVIPDKIQCATVEFVDIAGLVKGASKGEGLGNQFLSHIRDTSAIIHLVRCFDDPNVIHVDGSVDPIRDIDVINTELLLADIQSLEKKIERLDKQARMDKKLQGQLDIAKELLVHLNEGKPAAVFPKRDEEPYLALEREMRFISAKKVIFGANVDEAALSADNDYVAAVRKYADENGAEVVKICAKVEEEMAGMSDDEREEFLSSLGSHDGSGLEQIIHKGYKALGLISYFTAGKIEVRAWTIQKGWKAPKAASVIHNDFERGFIRAEVISYDDYIACKGESGARASGKLRTEGKEYEVKDGDVMHFLFNV
ncbi:MAG: redox-regulated ATPase YchF [Spirochaetota bacterium]